MFNCKMCGANLNVIEGKTIIDCEYCGKKQTIPKRLDPTLTTLFNRANTLRIKSEFDSAAKIYEKIIQAEPTQSDAYWGLILCKYGIEYVDDPKTFEKIPTCHRTSYDSVIADEDYKSAIQYADFEQKTIYEEQAKEIDRIQKEILALAQKEETYDVFICYKEKDENGHKTQDSVIANDIYYQLTNQGYKVFYAAITLEGKLGKAYEPIIFAALNSAKVMLVVGTKPEYFNAVWVKNEWSRYLKIIQKDRSKYLFPCYRDMDAYELPDEFSHLQAQDMSKIGFITDLIRGIQKVIVKNPSAAGNTAVLNNTNVNTAAPNTSPLLKRAYLSLEYGDWEKADNFAEQVLNQDPECAEAYTVKLLAELNFKKLSDLSNASEPVAHLQNYNMALRFASPEYKKTLEAYNDSILQKKSNAKKDEAYYNAISCMSNKLYDNAITIFQSLSGYRDSTEKLEACKELKETEHKEQIYNKAARFLSNYNASEANIRNSIQELETISGYKDADKIKDELNLKLQNIIQKANEAKAATAPQPPKKTPPDINPNEGRRKLPLIIVAVILLFAIAIGCFAFFFKPNSDSKTPENDNAVNEIKKDETINIGETTVKTLSNTAIYSGNLLLLDDTKRYRGEPEVIKLQESNNRPRNESGHLIYTILSAVRDKYCATEATATALNKMLKDFYEEKKDDNLFISGAYDTSKIDNQDAIYSSGETIALSYFHDYATNGINDQRTIAGVDTYKWIYANAHKYGFVAVSSNSNEFRYIGVTHATAMKTKGLSFSNYLNQLKNATPESPIKLDESGSYVAYYCPISDVKVPTNYEYEISGNNVDGVIITVKIDK